MVVVGQAGAGVVGVARPLEQLTHRLDVPAKVRNALGRGAPGASEDGEPLRAVGLGDGCKGSFYGTRGRTEFEKGEPAIEGAPELGGGL